MSGWRNSAGKKFHSFGRKKFILLSQTEWREQLSRHARDLVIKNVRPWREHNEWRQCSAPIHLAPGHASSSFIIIIVSMQQYQQRCHGRRDADTRSARFIKWTVKIIKRGQQTAGSRPGVDIVTGILENGAQLSEDTYGIIKRINTRRASSHAARQTDTHQSSSPGHAYVVVITANIISVNQ